MEERRTLEFFYEPTKKSDQINLFYIEDDKHVVGGREIINDGDVFRYYIVITSPTKAILFIKVVSDSGYANFDELLNSVDGDSLSIYRKRWPKLVKFMDDAIHENLSDAALLPIEIHGHKSFCIGRRVAIVNDEIDNEYIIREALELKNLAMDALIEYHNNDLTPGDKILYFLKGFGRGVRQYFRVIRIGDMFGL